jgi:hypothetical protein
MSILDHPDLPSGVFILPLVAGGTQFRLRQSTAELWGNLPKIVALTAPKDFIPSRADDDLRQQIDSVQPGVKAGVNTAALWDRPLKKRN